MKIFILLAIIFTLTGCADQLQAEQKARETLLFRFDDGQVSIIIDSKTGCRYILYAWKGISPLYKNSHEVDCDKENEQ